ncbi:MAG: TetR/AcrR family transcriptional regulator [Dysgonomonas sp.]
MDTQEHIVETAKKLFIENGYQATSIRDIATNADVNVSMINYYFRSKLNLFEIIFDDAFKIFTERISSILTSDLPFFTLIEKWVDSYYEILIKYPQISIFLLNEMNKGHEYLMDRVRKQGLYEIYVTFSKRVEHEVKKGTIKNIPSISIIMEVLSLCLFPFMFGKLIISFNNQPVETYSSIMNAHREKVIDLIISGLKK